MKITNRKRSSKGFDLKKCLIFTISIFLACFVSLFLTKPEFIYVQISPVGEKAISYNKIILLSTIVSIPSVIYFIFSS
jgi:hypothetical protein